MGGTAPLSDEIKAQTIAAYEANGRCITRAAKALGIPRTTFTSRYKRATLDKSVANLEPFIPEGQKLKGVSTLYNAAGEQVIQWVKTNTDLEKQLAMLAAAADALIENIPRETATAHCAPCNADLCSVYVLTDYHLGQMSWAGECGVDWNTEKSADFLVKWFASAIAAAPASEVGVLCQLGDFLHFDSIEAVTPTSKHLMDTDARYAAIVAAAIKAIRRIVTMMLLKHKHVHIKLCEGNHDISSSIWLRALFADKYADEPRITVDNTNLPYYVYEWGLTMLGFHHGHRRKMADMGKSFAAMYREIFGRTKYSYIHMGHYHHIASKEDGGFLVEQHPTMAPKDAYSARGAYVANRGASVITYSKIHGEVSRATCRPEMVQK